MKTKRWLCGILAAVAAFSCAACSDDEDSSTPNVKPEVTIDNPSYAAVQETAYDFFKNGDSDFTVVVPAEMNSNEETALSELNFFLEEAAGVTLPVVKDSAVAYDASKKYLSIGRTTHFDEANLQVNDDVLRTSGYMLKTVGKNLYMFGSNYESNGYGVIYAVYGFLEEMLNLKIYSTDCWTYDSLTQVKMKTFDVMEIPDYDYRNVSTVRKDTLYSARIRNLSGQKNPYATVHTQFEVLPTDTYYEEHPDWYNSKGSQLRLLNTEMRAEYIEQVKQLLRDQPEAELIYFGIEDNMDQFSAEDAALTKQLYNTNEAGLNIVFCNAVIEAIEEWLPTEFPGRSIIYETCAYYAHAEAPVTYDETTDTYTPHSEWVIPHEKLRVQITFMALPNWGQPIESEANKSMEQNIRKWASICDFFSVYSYGIHFRNYLMNFNNFSSFEANVRFGKTMGFNGWYELLASNTATPNFEELRLYVQSELLWDVSQDYQSLAKEFIDVYYGAAAPQVWEYFQLTISNNATQVFENNMTQGITTGNPAAEKFWPFELVDRMAKVLDEAEKQYDYLAEQDAEQYDVMVNRVRQQKVTVQYLQMQNYSHYYSKSDITAILDEMEKTVNKNSFLRIDERDDEGSIAKLIAEWRKNNA